MIAPHLLLGQQLSPEQGFRLRWGQPHEPAAAQPLVSLLWNIPPAIDRLTKLEQRTLAHLKQLQTVNSAEDVIEVLFPNYPTLLYGILLREADDFRLSLPLTDGELATLNDARNIINTKLNAVTATPAEFDKFYKGIVHAKVQR